MLTSSRRTFIAASAAFSLGRVLGANDKLNIGIVGIGGRGNDGVASLVSMVPGSIGYLEYSYALQRLDRISFGVVQNGAGKFVAPSSASFQAAVIESLVDRTRAAMAMFRADFPGCGAPVLVVAGGVAANKAIGDALKGLGAAEGFGIKIPPPRLCTDNAAMVAWAGVECGQSALFDVLGVAPKARWPLVETPARGE